MRVGARRAGRCRRPAARGLQQGRARRPRSSPTVMEVARRRGIPIVVDPKYRQFFEYAGATVFKPNRRELESALGAAVDLQNRNALPEVLARLKVDNLLVTLGAEGMVLVMKDGSLTQIPSIAREIYDVSGAGDTVTAWLGTALAAGRLGARRRHSWRTTRRGWRWESRAWRRCRRRRCSRCTRSGSIRSGDCGAGASSKAQPIPGPEPQPHAPALPHRLDDARRSSRAPSTCSGAQLHHPRRRSSACRSSSAHSVLATSASRSLLQEFRAPTPLCARKPSRSRRVQPREPALQVGGRHDQAGVQDEAGRTRPRRGRACGSRSGSGWRGSWGAGVGNEMAEGVGGMGPGAERERNGACRARPASSGSIGGTTGRQGVGDERRPGGPVAHLPGHLAARTRCAPRPARPRR